MRSSITRKTTCRRLWPVSGLVVAFVAALSVGVSQSGAAASATPKRGVVTITMAIVGDPGNPSVGVIQTFGGPKGALLTDPWVP